MINHMVCCCSWLDWTKLGRFRPILSWHQAAGANKDDKSLNNTFFDSMSPPKKKRERPPKQPQLQQHPPVDHQTTTPEPKVTINKKISLIIKVLYVNYLVEYIAERQGAPQWRDSRGVFIIGSGSAPVAPEELSIPVRVSIWRSRVDPVSAFPECSVLLARHAARSGGQRFGRIQVRSTEFDEFEFGDGVT